MNKNLKVLQISPTCFSPDSIMGGGERFVFELSRAMSHHADVRIISFGKKNQLLSDGDLKIRIIKPNFYIKKNLLNPFYLNLYKEFKDADVIHVHQIFTMLTEICIIWARILGKPIFLTDHGGGGRTFLSRFGVAKLATGLLPVSAYSSFQLKKIHHNRMVIHGGVDEVQYHPISNVAKIDHKIISYGRLLPHKGFHHLIRAIKDEALTIIGNTGDSSYLQGLKELSKNKNVTFLHNVPDSQLKLELASSSLAIFPSTNIGLNGEILKGEPELLGIAPLETMAMNLPTIVSNIGAYPEICFNEKNFMFEHANIEDLRKKIDHFWVDSSLANLNFREHVKTKFTWDDAIVKCLDFYIHHGGVQ